MLSGILRCIRYEFPELRQTLRKGVPCPVDGLTRVGRRTNSSLSRSNVIFSGIQPTGVPHLGNYLGALRQWSRLQNEATPATKLIFSIVDLHAITTRQDADQLRRWKRETLATLLASGLDPGRCTIFYQSTV